MPLTGKQRRALRALGHHLEPVVLVGQAGITEGVIGAIQQALQDHELIKVKITPDERKESAAELATASGSELVQVLGRSVLLYKPRKENPKIVV